MLHRCILDARGPGFACVGVGGAFHARADEAFFWATHAGAELDLLVVRGRRRLGFEIKRTSVPAVSCSMRAARETLRLQSVDVIHAGAHTFPLDEGFRAVAVANLSATIEPL